MLHKCKKKKYYFQTEKKSSNGRSQPQLLGARQKLLQKLTKFDYITRGSILLITAHNEVCLSNRNPAYWVFLSQVWIPTRPVAKQTYKGLDGNGSHKTIRTKHIVDLEGNLPASLWLPSQSSGICAEGLTLLQHLMAQHPGLERSQTGVAQYL